jgi:hypothetical protein
MQKEGWSQNYALEDKSEFAEVISLNDQNILFALKENANHQRSKSKDPSTESNPPRFGLPNDNPHRHRQKVEAVPHLHPGKITRAKLEPLRLARLIQGDQKITTRHAKYLIKTNNS